MIQTYNKAIVPRCIEFSKNQAVLTSERQKKLFSSFTEAFDNVLATKEKLDNYDEKGVTEIGVAQEVRTYLWKAGVVADKVVRFLSRDGNWPEFD